MGAWIRVENICFPPRAHGLALFYSLLSPHILYQHWERFSILGMCRNSQKQPAFGVLALGELSHPAHAAHLGTGAAPGAGEGSGTDTAGRCFGGLKLNFSPSQSTFLMLLCKSCLSICRGMVLSPQRCREHLSPGVPAGAPLSRPMRVPESPAVAAAIPAGFLVSLPPLSL